MKRVKTGFPLLVFLLSVGCRPYSPDSRLIFYRDSEGVEKPVKSLAEWQRKRIQILDSMQQAMGRLPDMSFLPPFDIQIRDSVREKRYTRLTISFTVAANEVVPAYLYVPSQGENRAKSPAMLVLHETGEAGKQLVDQKNQKPNHALARELAERGYVVIAPDYPSMGELADYDFQNDRYASGTMKALFNHIRCIDLLQTMQEVDPKRIGVIGHSLGGHNAMFVGAFDARLKVIVSSCGWTLMDYYDIGEEAAKKYGGRLGPWAQERYMPLLRDKYKLDTKKIPFDFDQVIAAIAPRAFFSNSPLNDSNFDVSGVRKGIEAASEVYRFLKAEDNLQVHYPDSGHDFPMDVREKAYRFIDKILQHTPGDPH
ncbi:MAG: alpha/beta fold hydrolase [Cyclobacteriaceae bacterium]